MLAENVEIVMYESHEDDEAEDADEEQDDADDHKKDKKHPEEDEEVVFGGASPKHGVKPRLPGVPLL